MEMGRMTQPFPILPSGFAMTTPRSRRRKAKGIVAVKSCGSFLSL